MKNIYIHTDIYIYIYSRREEESWLTVQQRSSFFSIVTEEPSYKICYQENYAINISHSHRFVPFSQVLVVVIIILLRITTLLLRWLFSDNIIAYLDFHHPMFNCLNRLLSHISHSSLRMWNLVSKSFITQCTFITKSTSCNTFNTLNFCPAKWISRQVFHVFINLTVKQNVYANSNVKVVV